MEATMRKVLLVISAALAISAFAKPAAAIQPAPGAYIGADTAMEARYRRDRHWRGRSYGYGYYPYGYAYRPYYRPYAYYPPYPYRYYGYGRPSIFGF